ncbi:hypothetical protein pb186bvf_001809 [Paramecium bursaria]
MDTEKMNTKGDMNFNNLNVQPGLNGVLINYEIRQLTIEDKEQFIKLTADSYFNDSPLQKVLDLNYHDCLQMAFNLDLDHILKTGFNYGAFHKNLLVSSMISFDYSNPGAVQKVEPNEKMQKFFDLVKQKRTEFNKQQFLPGEWILVRNIQTHPDQRGKKLTKILLQKCHEKWKEHKFKYAHLGAIHIVSKNLLFSLSSQQFIYSKADQLNGQPFYYEIIGIKLEYEQSNQ